MKARAREVVDVQDSRRGLPLPQLVTTGEPWARDSSYRRFSAGGTCSDVAENLSLWSPRTMAEPTMHRWAAMNGVADRSSGPGA